MAPNISLRYALAFAANQHSGHLMRRLARRSEVAIWPMPSGMIGIMSARPAFPRTALSARCPVQDGFMWPRSPIFINVKLAGRSRRRCGTSDDSGIGCDLLQLLLPIAAHGEQRQAIQFLDLAHHREHRLHRQRA